MEVPVYCDEPIHDAYKAIPLLPQPIKNTTTAATLKFERNYVIVSRREESYAEMKSEEYLFCLGTQLLILCTKPVALASAQDQLCLTSLLYNHEVAALKTCTREVTELPILPIAIYLGNSVYLLNAADDQQFLYNITYSGGKKFSNRVPACKSCLVHPPAMENCFTRRMAGHFARSSILSSTQWTNNNNHNSRTTGYRFQNPEHSSGHSYRRDSEFDVA